MLKKFWKRKKCKQETENVDEIIDHQECDESNQAQIEIKRRLYNYPVFAKNYTPIAYVGFSFSLLFSNLFQKHLKPSKMCFKKAIYNRIPAIKWIKKYKIKEFFLADLLAGITVGIMHIPQGIFK